MSDTTLSAPQRSATGPALWVSLLGAALPGIYLLLTSTTTLIPGIWPYDAKRILQFALLLTIFLFPAVNVQLRNTFGAVLAAVPRWAGGMLACIFAWGTVSALVNARAPMQLANSLSEVALLLCLVLAALVLAASRRVAGQLFDRTAVSLLALTGLVVGAQELLGVAAAHASGTEFSFRLSLLHFSWPRFYNQVQTWSIPVLTALPLLFARYSLARVSCVVVLGLNWYIIFMTGARGSLVALAAAFVFAMLFLPAARWHLARWQVPGFLLGIAIFGAVAWSFHASEQAGSASVGQTPAGPYFETEDFLGQSVNRPLLDPMGRIGMWKVTLRDAKANPAFGIGPMNYVCTSPQPIGHPHNFPLQIASEWGVPAALALCALCIAVFIRATSEIRGRVRGDETESALSSLLLTGVMAAAIHACVSGVLVMPASQTTGLLVCGLLMGLLLHGRTEATPKLQSFAWIGGLLLAVGLIFLGTKELGTLPERASLLTPKESLRPRMWQDARVCRLYLPQNEVSN